MTPARPDERPQPTFGDLAALVLEAEGAGMRIQYDDRVVASSEMPDQVGRTAYRIVQEGLTNVRKHAPGVTVVVQMSGSPAEGVSIRIRNPARSEQGLRRRAHTGSRAGSGRPGGARQARGWQPHDPAGRRVVRAHRMAAVADVSRTIRVLVVDDDALVRSGLVMILGGAPDIEVVGEAVDGQAGVDAARRHHPDVVLMDIRMPRMDGLRGDRGRSAPGRTRRR